MLVPRHSLTAGKSTKGGDVVDPYACQAATHKEPDKALPVIPAGADFRPPSPMLEPVLIVAIVIAATAWYVQHKWRKRLRTLSAVQDRRDGTILELLARRYARGEIDRDEFLQKRSDILGYPGMPPRHS
jgi:hypothetical protein